MKILVTGGCGFIGTNFIKHILDKYKDYKIINLDALTYCGNVTNLADVSSNPNYEFVKGSILDESLVFNLMNKVDACINFAAESHVDNSINNPMPFIETNIKGTFNLLEQARKTKLQRYIQISTDEVYGSLGKTGLFTESTPVSPNSPYSASKASSDLLVRAYFETYNLPASITRCSNNYGPYQHIEKLIPLFIINLLNNKAVPVYGNGLNIRDWLHVSDHCLGIDLVLHKGKIGEVYNIGGNNEKTNIEITKIILKQLNKPEDLINYVEDRLGHDKRYAIDNSKIKSELGFIPKVSFEDGIKSTIDWYVNNQKWVNELIKKSHGN